MISLGHPWLLVLLPLPVLIYRWVPPLRQIQPALRFPFFRQISLTLGQDPKPGVVIPMTARWHQFALAIMWGMLVLALAHPERVGAPVEVSKPARDLILAIDISGSMDTQDYPSASGPQQRLQAVRDVIKAFVKEREGDRVALIVFGSKAYLQAPLTEDLQTIVDLLDDTEVGMAGPHTALGDAIGLAIRTFENSDIDQRLLILLSDGSDTASRMDPVNAAEIAASRDVEIYTIAVGDPDASGEDQLDIQTLQDIAARTDGRYFFAGDSESLADIYAGIDRLAPRETESTSFRPRQTLVVIPMSVAALAGVLLLLSNMPRGIQPHV